MNNAIDNPINQIIVNKVIGFDESKDLADMDKGPSDNHQDENSKRNIEQITKSYLRNTDKDVSSEEDDAPVYKT